MSTTDWQIISERSLNSPVVQGGFLAAYCHCHHHNRHRTLSINRENGFGKCFRCDDRVLVEELNPDAAAVLRRVQRLPAATIRVKDPKYCLPKAPPPPVITAWQQQEIDFLRAVQPAMEKHLTDERACAYLDGREISLATAQCVHAGYIPAGALKGKYLALRHWTDRIIFPVQSKDRGTQYVGRSLHLWEPGMDELTHTKLLDQSTTRRWYKTHATGWLNFRAMTPDAPIIFVEGAFDLLALMEAGLTNTVAIIGTALEVNWLPPRLRPIIALDGDESGREKSAAAQKHLYEHGYDAEVCCVPDDGRGKDWSERYRLHGREGLLPLLEEVLVC